MAVTRIHTTSLPRLQVSGQGSVAEVLNEALAGARNVSCALRWLSADDFFSTPLQEDAHQLIYLMEGEGIIRLSANQFEVAKGAGIYLGPSETAEVRHRGSVQLRLFHIVVPIRGDSALDE